MGNNTFCKVTEIGFIRLKMSDGIARELTTHVPELKMNLISLSMLVRQGIILQMNLIF